VDTTSVKNGGPQSLEVETKVEDHIVWTKKLVEKDRIYFDFPYIYNFKTFTSKINKTLQCLL
jgi:hypothetical protein